MSRLINVTNHCADGLVQRVHNSERSWRMLHAPDRVVADMLESHHSLRCVLQHVHGNALCCQLLRHRDAHHVRLFQWDAEPPQPAVLHTTEHLMQRTLVRPDQEVEVRDLFDKFILDTLANRHGFCQLTEIPFLNVIRAFPEALPDLRIRPSQPMCVAIGALAFIKLGQQTAICQAADL